MTGALIASKYQVLRRLAVGGMAEVHLARQVGPDGFEKLVVLKSVLPQMLENEAFIRMFLDEARTAADLRHPHVVTVHEVLRDHETYYLVLEYVHGPSLDRVLHKLENHRLDIGLALQIGVQVAHGLHYAHRKTDLRGQPLAIVHRDVSPQNILLAYDGFVKIADFGIAKAATSLHQTQPGVVKGKLRYMAPEQIEGRDATPATDQFALGCVLYEATTGRHPFAPRGDDGSLLTALRDASARPPHEFDESYPPPLAEVLLRALERDPKARWSSCDELATALQRVARDLDLDASPTRLSELLREVIPPTDPFQPRDETPAVESASIDVLSEAIENDDTQTFRYGEGSRPAVRVTEGTTGTNLRDTPIRFIGRVGDLASLQSLVDARERLITVVGPGGAGKTRLAVRFGLQSKNQFEGGVWFCDLSEARTQSGILGVVGGVLGVPLARGTDPEQKVLQLGHAVASRGRALIIFDNLEQVVEEANQILSAWLRITESTFITTSRTLLRHDAEVSYELGPLSLPTSDVDIPESEAVQLFVDRARRVRRDFRLTEDNAEFVAAIVNRLDGLPLAIELAAARMNMFSPSSLLSRLNERFQLLDGHVRGTKRQATLRGAIDWSMQLLEPWERAAIEQCDVFRGGFTLEAAEAVLDLTEFEEAPWVPDVLQSLRDKSLLRVFEPAELPGELRFSMYESIRAYVEETISPETLRSLQQRHAQYYLRVGRQWAEAVYSHGGLHLRRRLSVERDNLMAVHQNSLLEHTTDGAERALQAVLALDPVLSIQGPYHTHIRLLDEALAQAQELGVESRIRAHALLHRGQILAIHQQTEAAATDYEEALQISRQLGAEAMIGRAIGALGRVRQLQGHIDTALELYGEALERLRAAGDKRHEAIVLGGRALARQEQARLEAAREDFEHSLRLFREVGDVRQEGMYIGNLGIVYQHLKQLDVARRHFEKAIDLAERAGDRRFQGIFGGGLAILDHEQDQFESARRRYLRAISELRSIGDRHFEGVFVGYLGILEQEENALEEARNHFQYAVNLFEEVGWLRNDTLFRGFLAGVLALTETGDAAAQLERALQQAGQIGDPMLVVTLHLHRALVTGENVDEAIREATTPGESGRPPTEESDEVRMALRVLRRARVDVH